MILLLLLSVWQEDKPVAYLSFPKGTVWVYEESEGGKKSTFVLTYQGEEGGRAILESVVQREGRSETKPETMVWYVEDGCVTWGIRRGETVKALWRIHKPGSRKGDVWKGAGETGETRATHLGTTDFKVLAGEFKNAVHIHYSGEAKDEGSFHFYVAPKVGLLKMEMDIEGETLLLELKEFRPGK